MAKKESRPTPPPRNEARSSHGPPIREKSHARTGSKDSDTSEPPTSHETEIHATAHGGDSAPGSAEGTPASEEVLALGKSLAEKDVEITELHSQLALRQEVVDKAELAVKERDEWLRKERELVAQLQKQISVQQDSIRALNEQLERNQEESAQRQAQVNESDGSMTVIKTQLKKSIDECEQLKQKIAEQQKKSQEELDGKQSSETASTQRPMDLSTQVESLSTQLSNAEAQVSELQKQAIERNERVQELEKQDQAQAQAQSKRVEEEWIPVQQEVERLRRQLKERDEQVDQLRQKLELTAARVQEPESSVLQAQSSCAPPANWANEREQMVAETARLRAQLEEEQSRADSAEERVRDLRYTNEESRRAIMRLQSSRPSGSRSDHEPTQRHVRRSSHILSTLAGRSSDNDTEHERTGLRDLRLVSPALTGNEEFSPPTASQARMDDTHTDYASLHAAGEDVASSSSNMQASGITGLFPSSLLRSSLGLTRKSTPAGSDDTSSWPLREDFAAADELRSEYGKLQRELQALKEEFGTMQHQLTESREAEQASQTMITSLREYIMVTSQTGGTLTGEAKHVDAPE